MIFSKSFFILLFWVLSLIITTLLTVLSLQQEYMAITTAGLIILGILQVIALIRYVYRKDREFDYFIEAISNQDTSAFFTRIKDKHRSRKLYDGYNKVLDNFHQLNSEKVHREVVWAQTLEQITIGMLAYDKNGQILLVNKYFLKLLSLSELKHLTALNRVSPKLTHLLQTLQPGNNRTIKLQHNHQLLQLSLSATKIKQANQLPYMLVSIKEVSVEMAKSEQEAWQKMIRILRHEVTNSVSPVRLLSGSLLQQSKQILQQEQNKSLQQFLERLVQGLEAIHVRSEGLVNFVERYRVFTNLECHNPAPLSIIQLTHEAMAVMDATFHKHGITVKMKGPEELPPIRGDKHLLSQVILNLLKNALEAVTDSANKHIGVYWQLTENGQQLTIEDSGKGISEELLEEVFTPFFTTKPKGTGIGLSLSRQIVLAHQGNLELHSELGKGTAIRLFFPSQNRQLHSKSKTRQNKKDNSR
ncbi:MAG: sensor histidine kinase [Bacteroidota bacterium]